MRVVVVYGKAHSGKTHILKEVDKLISAYYYVSLRYPLFTENDDFTLYVEVLINGKKMRIGIASNGDNEKAIEQGLGILIDRSCDLIFCACRNYGRALKKIEYYKALHGFELRLCSKNVTPWYTPFTQKAFAEYIMSVGI